MKKLFLVIAFLASLLGFSVVSAAEAAGGGSGTITQLPQWLTSGGYIKAASSTAGIWVPSLGSTGAPCITVGTTGKFSTSTCGAAGSQTPILQNVDMGGFNFTNGGTITARNFIATSTTATSTFREFSFTNATGTNLSVTGSSSLAWANLGSTTANSLSMPSILSALILTNANGAFSAYAGTPCTNQFIRSLSALGAATCASVALATDVSGDLPFANLTQGAANTVLANPTGATADFQAVATSSLYGTGVAGQVLSYLNGVIKWAATTTAGTGLTYTGSAFNVNTSQNIATLSNLTTNGFVQTSGGVGTLGVQAFPCTMAQGCTGLTTNSSSTILFGTGSGWTTMATTSSNIFVGSNGQTLAYLNGGWTGAATTTFTNTSPITTTYGANNTWTIACASCVTTSRNINTTYPVTGGGALSGDLTIALAFGTTTTNTWSNLQTFTSGFISNSSSTLVGGWTVTGNATDTNATSTNSFWSKFVIGSTGQFGVVNSTTTATSTFTGGIAVTNGVFQATTTNRATFATTTTTGTTTYMYGLPSGNALVTRIRCHSDTGTFRFDFYNGTASTTMSCSSTAGQTWLTSNNLISTTTTTARVGIGTLSTAVQQQVIEIDYLQQTNG